MLQRKYIEQCFGWVKLIGPIRQVMVRGLDKVNQTLTMTVYKLARLRILAALGAAVRRDHERVTAFIVADWPPGRSFVPGMAALRPDPTSRPSGFP